MLLICLVIAIATFLTEFVCVVCFDFTGIIHVKSEEIVKASLDDSEVWCL